MFAVNKKVTRERTPQKRLRENTSNFDFELFYPIAWLRSPPNPHPLLI